MNIKGSTIQPDSGEPFFAVKELAVFQRGGGGEPATVATHDFVDDQHARVGVVLRDDILKITGTLFSGGPGT